jgi:hypothetical protein
MFERIFPYFLCCQVAIAILLSAAAFIVHVIERNIRGKRFNRLPLWLAGAATTTDDYRRCCLGVVAMNYPLVSMLLLLVCVCWFVWIASKATPSRWTPAGVVGMFLFVAGIVWLYFGMVLSNR